MIIKFIQHLIFFIAVLTVLFGFRSRLISSDICQVNESSVTSIYSPPCVKMYYAIEYYSEKYGVPKKYAYGLAYEETRYRGPFDWKYDPEQISSFNARGPMQIVMETAKMMWPGRVITEHELLTDVDFNVETSMRCIKHLHEVYGDWKLAFGAYNTGSPVVNQYALNVYLYKSENGILSLK